MKRTLKESRKQLFIASAERAKTTGHYPRPLLVLALASLVSLVALLAGSGSRSASAAFTPRAPIVTTDDRSTIVQGVGSDATVALNTFRNYIGGVDNGGAAIPQIGGRREINW